ncbi:hypothetical protein C5H21_12955, partial [Xylella fastidiosa]
TLYDIPDGECRRIARRGPVYNPYRERTQELGGRLRGRLRRCRHRVVHLDMCWLRQGMRCREFLR